jgi:hypothetical protein
MPVELEPITRIPDEPQITTSGQFLAGTIASFTFTFNDIEGVLFDPSDIDITILDENGTTVETGESADKLTTGLYAWDWAIPADQAPGLYSIRVDYVVEQPDGSSTEFFTESFVVGEAGIEIITPQTIAFRNFVESLIGYTQRIPVFHEIGRLSNDRTVATFSFPRWNQPAGSRVFINGRLKEPDQGFSVNYLTGKITFVDVLSSVDEVSCSYSFRWFSDGEIDAFVVQALEVFNQYPPHSVYLLDTLPPRYGVTVAHQAAVFVLRRLIMDLHFQEPAKVFGGMDRADKLMGTLGDLKKNIEEEINRLYDQKKLGPYIGLTRTVTVPEFTLPGGRSRWFRYLFKGA